MKFGELEGQPTSGSADGELGPYEYLEGEGHELVTTTDREGSELEENLADADILITTPFWPVYVTREMMESASNLKLILTAGVGSVYVAPDALVEALEGGPSSRVRQRRVDARARRLRPPVAHDTKPHDDLCTPPARRSTLRSTTPTTRGAVSKSRSLSRRREDRARPSHRRRGEIVSDTYRAIYETPASES